MNCFTSLWGVEEALQLLCEPCGNDDISRVVWRVSDEIQSCREHWTSPMTVASGNRMRGGWGYQWGSWSFPTSGSFDVYNHVVQSIFIPCPERRAPHTVLQHWFSQQRRQTDDPPLPTAAATAASQPPLSGCLAAGLTRLLLQVTWAHILKHFGAHTSTFKAFVRGVGISMGGYMSLIGYQEDWWFAIRQCAWWSAACFTFLLVSHSESSLIYISGCPLTLEIAW